MTTAEDKSDEELKKSREQLRNLAARLQQVREEEKIRLAREIHDQLSGTLAALNMELSLLPERVAQDVHQAVARDTSDIFAKIQHAIEFVRTIASELRPIVLDQFGIIAAIEWEAQQFERRSGIHCKVALPGEDISLNPERSTAVFRVCQEALMNVALHANASAASITIRREDEILILEIRDNGKGIRPGEISDGKSLGILGMRERALACGGDLKISGAPGEGTLVELRMPIA